MQIENELIKIFSSRFSKAFERISHSIRQLDNKQIWYRPSSSSNSVGIIVQHLSGNLNQWVCSAIGGETFQRNRPQEFIESEMISKREILLKITELDKKIQSIVLQIKPEFLLSSRRIQGFDETVLSALIAALTHFELHSGQITFLAKLMLDKEYKTSWQPMNKEQGRE
ncbi:MAG: DUF1572 family protein [Bacteroidota bacterium]